MSYEGYDQELCAKGHYQDVDCLERVYLGDGRICNICKEEIVWWNPVDETNGCECDAGCGEHSCDPKSLEVDKPAETCKCQCGHVHVVKQVTYKIPSKEIFDD